MNKKYLIYVLTILTLVICVLLVLRLKYNKGESSKVTKDISEYAFSIPLPDNPYLTEADKKVFMSQPTTSVAARQFFKDVAQASVEVSTVVMDGCNPNPVVAQVRKGASLGFRNLASSTVTIRLPSQTLNIRGGYTVNTEPFTWDTDFKGNRTLLYFCNSGKTPVGYIHVTS